MKILRIRNCPRCQKRNKFRRFRRLKSCFAKNYSLAQGPLFDSNEASETNEHNGIGSKRG